MMPMSRQQEDEIPCDMTVGYRILTCMDRHDQSGTGIPLRRLDHFPPKPLRPPLAPSLPNRHPRSHLRRRRRTPIAEQRRRGPHPKRPAHPQPRQQQLGQQQQREARLQARTLQPARLTATPTTSIPERSSTTASAMATSRASDGAVCVHLDRRWRSGAAAERPCDGDGVYEC